jgi:hypothetical protein
MNEFRSLDLRSEGAASVSESRRETSPTIEREKCILEKWSRKLTSRKRGFARVFSALHIIRIHDLISRISLMSPHDTTAHCSGAFEQERHAVRFVRHQPTGRLICGDRASALVHPGSTKPCCWKAGKKCGEGWRLVGGQTPAHGETG